jgi:hypothetical protein
MNEEIGLQELIYQIKNELLAPNQAQRAKDPNPIFFIDKVELEIAVKVQKEGSAGIKLSVLSFAELNAGASATRERGHVVKVSLSPLLTKEEILEKLFEDPKVRKRIEDRLVVAMAKGAAQLAGAPE